MRVIEGWLRVIDPVTGGVIATTEREREMRIAVEEQLATAEDRLAAEQQARIIEQEIRIAEQQARIAAEEQLAVEQQARAVEQQRAARVERELREALARLSQQEPSL